MTVISRRGFTGMALSMGASSFVSTDTCAAGMTLTIERFGGSSTAGFSNVAALRRAFSAAQAGGVSTITLGAGTYEVAAAELLRDGPITRPGGIALAGKGRSMTTLRVTGGGSINYLFDASGQSNVDTRSMTIVGNGVGSDAAPYSGALMRAVLAGSATADMTALSFTDCDIENFASATWVFVANESSRFFVSDVLSRGCNWISRRNTAPGAGNIAVPGHFIYCYGVANPVRNVVVDDDLMDATHVKGGVALVGNIAGGSIRIKTLRNPGQGLASVKAGPAGNGAYGVLLYQRASGGARSVSIDIDRMENPYSAGVYIAGGRSIDVRIGTAFGQRDTRDSSIFKGVVAIVGSRDVRVRLGRVFDCNRVVMIALDGGTAVDSNTRANIDIDLGVVTSRAGAEDVVIAASDSVIGGVRIRGSRSGPAAVGVEIRVGRNAMAFDLDLGDLVSRGAKVPLVLPQVAGRVRMTGPLTGSR